ncbi:hypothetical protein V6N13_016720 [Hibiscus sabdariffa]|uniref:Uncharacterized protein n=1 Tax=Hibiscus sabdariffa TaxID=183260 RepID=A0ABR2PUJ0_9ROSI
MVLYLPREELADQLNLVSSFKVLAATADLNGWAKRHLHMMRFCPMHAGLMCMPSMPSLIGVWGKTPFPNGEVLSNADSFHVTSQLPLAFCLLSG